MGNVHSSDIEVCQVSLSVHSPVRHKYSGRNKLSWSNGVLKNQSGNHMKTATEIVFILPHILPFPYYSIILLVLILFIFHFHLSSYSSWVPLLTQLVIGILKILRNILGYILYLIFLLQIIQNPFCYTIRG